MNCCAICIDDIKIPFKLEQCSHSFHPVCVMKVCEEYLLNFGTEWQTVPCPICKKRISYHILLKNCVEQCEIEDIVQIVNKNNINTKCHMDRSLLMVAAAAGKMDTVKYLIDQGLSIDDPNNFGLTVFYNAVSHGQLDIVKYLVENYNVNINCESFFGDTCLDMALKNNYITTAEYLQSINAKNGTPKNQDWFMNINENNIKKYIPLLLPNLI